MQRLTAIARRRFATTSTLYVDGATAAASDGQLVKTHSPADGSVLAELSDASADDARRAVAAAARCHASGAYFRDGAARRDALERAAAALREDATVYATNEARARCGVPGIFVDSSRCSSIARSHAIAAASSRLLIRAGLRQDVRGGRGRRGLLRGHARLLRGSC